ncbi:LysM peptidoglycan-binding domain-containing protein [Geobacter sp. AOG1]|uniref:LysM peptidoglycan-binding domain-containing protein n=1 Tax=Geobacter sp. AOG1 TaxID=1566346 RepID=UPI001CC35DEF|nr:LysM peptidoglycan-binding domain-containing protein [Geobacter sp. AOG1]GFE57663.1 peptidoglycan-binding protein LysM [Geobacter sp. AOG1]
MKLTVRALLFLLLLTAGYTVAWAQDEEPTIYVIQKGDTLWGLSDKFLKDPHYWPPLWAKNPSIGNPHFIFPGQKLRIFADRIEIVDEKGAVPPVPAPSPEPEGVVPERVFTVTGGEGFLLEGNARPVGHIISTFQNRQIVGEDDIVYADIGKVQGVKTGDRFSIFKEMEAVSHPVNHVILGHRVIPLGSLQISELEEKSSKALITKSYLEIGAGAYLMPYRERKKIVSLKAPAKDLNGYIVETQTGNKAIATGDVVFLDMGKGNGLEPGNMLYVVRDVVPDQKFLSLPIGKLPIDVVGAVVVVETGETTSTALVVKSIDTIYRGDRVEMRK